ncbi:MAG: hypothetical protein FRX48_05993 [Lasallia pustulata]|uniref:Uncharacterized protein n=1 Tax=Lasallia pustulata TaxID=136370 RepID=A0A5M8PM51_9LECA|nr:MAG: hypothetical protein FRX48_05993 [Lasallia pustulata]
MASEHNTPSKTSSYPVAPNRLNQLAADACDSTFRTATTYDHSQASSWNTSIINSILQSLISATSSSNAPPSYKYAVTSTIIQHTSPPAPPPPTADDFPPPRAPPQARARPRSAAAATRSLLRARMVGEWGRRGVEGRRAAARWRAGGCIRRRGVFGIKRRMGCGVSSMRGARRRGLMLW